MESKQKYIETYTSVRPRRIAFLLPAFATREWIYQNLIPWMSTTWGGGNSFIFPIYKSEMKHEDFYKWLKLLRKFDPDAVVSLGQFSKRLQDVFKSSLLSIEDVFQFNPSVGILNTLQRDTLYTSSLENVLSEDINNEKFVLKEYSPVQSKIINLWFYSHYGSVGAYESKLTEKKIEVEKENHSVDKIIRLINRTSLTKNYDLEKSPLQKSMQYLGSRGAKGYFTQYKSPKIIIVGDGIQDWALYQSLRYMYLFVEWYPVSMLDLNGKKESSLNYRLFNEFKNDEHKEKIVTSTTLNKKKIEAVFKRAKENCLIHSARSGNYKYRIEVDFNSIIENWLNWGEPNNTKNKTIVFEEDRSIEKLAFTYPKSFKLNTSNSNFLNEVDFSQYSICSHPQIGNTSIRWQNDKAVLEDDARVNYLGGIVFNPVGHLIMVGQDVESVLRSPRIVKKSVLDVFTEILSGKELHIHESVGTRNIRAALKLFDGSLENFLDSYYIEDTSRIFEAYRKGKKATFDEKINLKKSFGITISQQLYFSYPLEKKFKTTLKDFNSDKLDRWLQKGILIRGIKLSCANCGYVSFYSESSVTDKFICKRCEEKQRLSRLTIGKDEPSFVYDMNSILFGLQENDSDIVLKAVNFMKGHSLDGFDWTAEIKISKDGKEIQEIDVVAVSDGKISLCECKKSREISDDQIEKYVRICKNNKIDRMYFYSEKGWGNKKQRIESMFKDCKFTELIFN